MECNSFLELEEYSMYYVYSTSKSGVAGIVMIDLHDFGLLFRNRMISVPFKLEYVVGGVQNTYSSYSSSRKSQCSLRFAPHLLFWLRSQGMLMRLLPVRRLVNVLCQRALIEYWGCCWCYVRGCCRLIMRQRSKYKTSLQFPEQK